jgi:hypothetical protein
MSSCLANIVQLTTNADRQLLIAFVIKRFFMDFKERKQKRIEHFEKHIKGWKQRPCTACNGSGYYDHNGSPKCGACNGTGRERYLPKTAL